MSADTPTEIEEVGRWYVGMLIAVREAAGGLLDGPGIAETFVARLSAAGYIIDRTDDV